MKRCSICKLDKEPAEFNKNKSRKDGLQSHCRLCSHNRFKTYYQNNHEKHRNEVRKRNAKIISNTREYVWNYLLTHPCIDCGNTDIRVLEFDHVRGVKVSGVGQLAGSAYGIEAVQKEIDKCEVRCRNCHTIKTYERLGGSWHDIFLNVIQ